VDRVIALLFCLAVMAASAQPVRDDLGRDVMPLGAGKRVVSLSPFVTEIAFAAGAGGDLVGASEYSDFPEAARALPPVANALGISWEKLIALRPDLVLAWRDGVRPADIARMESLGARVFVMAGRRLDDIARSLRSVAALTGRGEPPAARQFELHIAGLRDAYARERRVSVFFELSHRPLLTLAGPHFVNDALSLCGAENLFQGLPDVAPAVSWEDLMAKDPQVIVGVGGAGRRMAFEGAWQARASLRAVRNNALVYVEADNLLRPTPRLASGIEELCRGIGAVRKGALGQPP
jgi:iron complex transport system substrate-binding protein